MIPGPTPPQTASIARLLGLVVAAAVVAGALGVVGPATAGDAPAVENVTATPADVENGGDETVTTFEVASDRDDPFDVRVSSRGLDAGELSAVFEASGYAVEQVEGDVVIRSVEAGADLPADFEGVPAATYRVEFTAPDSDVGDSAAVAVAEREVDGGFGSDVYETRAGELVDVEVSLDGTDEGYVLVGGDRTSDGAAVSNFLDVVYVAGSTTIRVNTRLLGTDAPTEAVYDADGEVVSYLQDPHDDRLENVTFVDESGETVADDLASFRSAVGVTSLAGPLQPERYRLLVGADGEIVLRDDGVPDVAHPLGRSNLLLTDPDAGGSAFSNATLYAAPTASASATDDAGELRGDLVERDHVVAGERLVVGFEARGLWGWLSWTDGQYGTLDGDAVDPVALSALLESTEGVSLEGHQTNPGRNEPVTDLDVANASDGDVVLLPDGDGDDPATVERYYLVVDTRGGGPFDRDLRPGDEFELELGYLADDDVGFPYLDPGTDDQIWNATFAVESPSVTYDRVDADRRPVVANDTDARLSGTTNVAPGTDVTVQLVAEDQPPPTKITIDDVDVAADGSFELVSDFSALQPGEHVDLEFYVDERLHDERTVRVVEETVAFPVYEVTAHPESAVLDGDDGPLRVTVLNDGVVSGNQTVRLLVENESVAERAVVLDGGSDRTVTFPDVGAEFAVGEYNYTVATEDHAVEGRFTVVEPSDDDSSSDTTPGSSTAGGGADGDADDDGPGDDPDPDGVGPLGVPAGARHAVGGAVVVGLVHVLGHWT